SWTGPPPPLPIEVVRELAERARAAERALRQQRAEALAKKRPPIRVRALIQPTFVRFVFDMPDGIGASSIFNDQKLTLSFNALLTFDLADALVATPPNVASIKQRIEGDRTLVELEMVGDVDVHSFREDKTYNIDVSFQQPDKAKVQTLPTADAGQLSAGKPKKETGSEKHSEGAATPVPEAIALPMKAEVKPEAKSETKTDLKTERAAAEAPKVEVKPEMKAEPKTEAKAESKPAHAAEAAKTMAEPAPPANPEAAKKEAPAPAPDALKVTEAPKPDLHAPPAE